jgi:hypothetical protein
MSDGVWTDLLSDYKIQYNTLVQEWKELKSFDASRDVNSSKRISYIRIGVERE